MAHAPRREGPGSSGGIERHFEDLLFRSRWLLVPIYFGLILCLAILVFLMLIQFIDVVHKTFSRLNWQSIDKFDSIIIPEILSIIDISLVANLLLMVILVGYQGFVSEINMKTDRPKWLGRIDFSDLKLRLMGAIVAISAIQLLRLFFEVAEHSKELPWMIGIHLAFVVSGVLLAVMDRLAAGAHHLESGGKGSEATTGAGASTDLRGAAGTPRAGGP